MSARALLRVRAEIVFGVLLVVRSRAVQIAYLLSLVVVCFSILGYLRLTSHVDQMNTVFFIGGALSAVAASRLLTPGSCIAAARQVAAPFWLVPLGRLTGGIIVVLPAVTVSAVSLQTTQGDVVGLTCAAAIYATAVASAVLALAPAVGGSMAALAGFVLVCIGFFPVDEVRALSEVWPTLKNPLELLLQVLPLQWRVIDDRTWIDTLVLLAWTVFGIVLAGWEAKPVMIKSRRLLGFEWRF